MRKVELSIRNECPFVRFIHDHESGRVAWCSGQTEREGFWEPCTPGEDDCYLLDAIELTKDVIADFKRQRFAGYPTYQEYLQSDHWKELSAKAKEWAGNKCQLCNKDGELHTHHRTYERLGQELAGDLIVLCADCHAKFHDKEVAANGSMVSDQAGY